MIVFNRNKFRREAFDLISEIFFYQIGVSDLPADLIFGFDPARMAIMVWIDDSRTRHHHPRCIRKQTICEDGSAWYAAEHWRAQRTLAYKVDQCGTRTSHRHPRCIRKQNIREDGSAWYGAGLLIR